MVTPGKLVVLKLEGNLKLQGFRVTLEIGMENDRPSIEMMGELPAEPELWACLDHWQAVYRKLGIPTRIVPQAIIYGGSVNRMDECRQVSRKLRERFTAWLEAPSFQKLDRRLRDVLKADDAIRVLIRTDNRDVKHLPWHFWDFIERYPKAEIAVGATEFEQHPPNGHKVNRKVRILAILGNRTGIDIEADRQILERLPNAEVTFLVEPKRHEINHQLWDQAWNILFFAGHGETQADEGFIHINQHERLTFSELEYGVKQAIDNGLELAIFNSCDGLGLANQLAPLHLPQMMVMREAVPDRVAQEFLKYFLMAYVRGDSLYLAERRARERLQGLEDDCPCASWIPVIFQNSSDPPPTWAQLLKPPQRSAPFFGSTPTPKSLWAKLKLPLVSSWIVTSLVMGARLTGLLEPVELFVYDRMMVSRPTEQPDSRLLLITNDEPDVQYQMQQRMPMNASSLSDQALALLMQKLAPHRPAAVGLDIYRDDPHFPRDRALNPFIKNLTFTCVIGNSQKSVSPVPSPPKVPLNQVGFANISLDSDGIMRRQTLGMYSDSRCTDKSFSYRLAMRYLTQSKVSLVDGQVKIGSRVFPNLSRHAGGYHQPYLGGFETLLNYRATEKIAPTLPLSEVLQGKHDRELTTLVPGRIVLIGTIARSYNDYSHTPYGRMAGGVIQAHMISQIMSAVEDQRVLLWWLPPWSDVAVIWFWGMVGAGLAVYLRSKLYLGFAIAAASGVGIVVCYGIFLRGGWLPLVPSVLALTATGSSVAYVKLKC